MTKALLSSFFMLLTINFFEWRKVFHGRKFLGHEETQKGTKQDIPNLCQLFVQLTCDFLFF